MFERDESFVGKPNHATRPPTDINAGALDPVSITPATHLANVRGKAARTVKLAEPRRAQHAAASASPTAGRRMRQNRPIG